MTETAEMKEVVALITKTGKTKIPVYKSTLDNITGVVFLFDLLGKHVTLSQVLRPVMYVPENKKCNELLREFQAANASIAVVIDEYGGTAGIVTLEDVAEELFGELEEALAGSSFPIIKINKITWKIRGTESIESINEQLGVDIPGGEYETIAGFVLFTLNRIPEIGEKIVLQDCNLIVTKADEKKINEIRLVKKEV